MFGISGEHLLVLLVILLVFGPKRLPDLGHSLGRTLKNFKDAMNTSINTTPEPPLSAGSNKPATTPAAPEQIVKAATPAEPTAEPVVVVPAHQDATSKQEDKV